MKNSIPKKLVNGKQNCYLGHGNPSVTEKIETFRKTRYNDPNLINYRCPPNYEVKIFSGSNLFLSTSRLMKLEKLQKSLTLTDFISDLIKGRNTE